MYWNHDHYAISCQRIQVSKTSNLTKRFRENRQHIDVLKVFDAGFRKWTEYTPMYKTYIRTCPDLPPLVEYEIFLDFLFHMSIYTCLVKMHTSCTNMCANTSHNHEVKINSFIRSQIKQIYYFRAMWRGQIQTTILLLINQYKFKTDTVRKLLLLQIKLHSLSLT